MGETEGETEVESDDEPGGDFKVLSEVYRLLLILGLHLGIKQLKFEIFTFVAGYGRKVHKNATVNNYFAFLG